jgi:hypothetical protein
MFLVLYAGAYGCFCFFRLILQYEEKFEKELIVCFKNYLLAYRLKKVRAGKIANSTEI